MWILKSECFCRVYDDLLAGIPHKMPEGTAVEGVASMFNPNFKKCSTTIALNGSPSNCLMENRRDRYSPHIYLGYVAVPITEKGRNHLNLQGDKASCG